MSLARYLASWSFLMSSFLTEEAIHLPPAPDLDIFGVLLRAENAKAWVLELEIGKAETERGHERGRGNPYPLIKAMNIERLLTRLKIRLFPKAV